MKYYGVYGLNGCGVYTDYEGASFAMRYLSRSKIKYFYNRSEAENYAILGFSDYNVKASFIKQLPLNFTVYPKDIDKYM